MEKPTPCSTGRRRPSPLRATGVRSASPPLPFRSDGATSPPRRMPRRDSAEGVTCVIFGGGRLLPWRVTGRLALGARAWGLVCPSNSADRPRLRDRQGPTGLHHLLWR